MSDLTSKELVKLLRANIEIAHDHGLTGMARTLESAAEFISGVVKSNAAPTLRNVVELTDDTPGEFAKFLCTSGAAPLSVDEIPTLRAFVMWLTLYRQLPVEPSGDRRFTAEEAQAYSQFVADFFPAAHEPQDHARVWLMQERDKLKARVAELEGAPVPPNNDLAIDVAGALERRIVKETVVAVYRMASDRGTDYWSGFTQACDEIACRLQEHYGEEMSDAEAWVLGSVTKPAPCNHYEQFKNDDGTCALCIPPETSAAKPVITWKASERSSNGAFCSNCGDRYHDHIAEDEHGNKNVCRFPVGR